MGPRGPSPQREERSPEQPWRVRVCACVVVVVVVVGAVQASEEKGYTSCQSGLRLANAATEGGLNDPSSGQDLPLNW